jgi:tetratricopeptide (TPR) repeat protein
MQKKMSRGHDPRSGHMRALLFMLILLLSSATSILAHPEPPVTLPPREEFSNGFPDGEGSYQLAYGVISLLGPSHEQAIAALNGVEQDGEPYESMSEKLLSGEEAAAEAFNFFSSGAYRSAIESATEAMRLFDEVIRMVLEAEPEQDEDAAEEEAMNALGLAGEIERELSYLDKVRRTVIQLGKNGYNISEYEAVVEQAENHLLLAEGMLGDDDVESAGAEESVAMEVLDKAMELLRRENEETKTEKASKFLEKTEERLERLEDRITEKFGELDSGQGGASMHQAFQDARNTNQAIKCLIEAGEMDVALGRFKKVLEDEDVVWGIVESLDEDFAEKLREKDEETDEEDEEDDVKDKEDKEDDVKDEEDPKGDQDDKDDKYDVKDEEDPKGDQDDKDNKDDQGDQGDNEQ